MRALLLLIASTWLVHSGCETDATRFQCGNNSECIMGGASGVCEPNSTCSFPDSSCPSGRRYGDRSGVTSKLCVEASSIDSGIDDIDASIDAAIKDASADVALLCASGFEFVPASPGTGSVNVVRYSHPTPYVYVGFDISGPGTVAANDPQFVGTIDGINTWSMQYTVSAPGIWNVTFTYDMGVAGESCMFAVADTGAPPGLP